jgi:hypothetical protein
MDLGEIGWGGMDWIDLDQDRDQWRALVNMGMNLQVPKNAGKFLSSCTTGGLLRRAQIQVVCCISVSEASLSWCTLSKNIILSESIIQVTYFI